MSAKPCFDKLSTGLELAVGAGSVASSMLREGFGLGVSKRVLVGALGRAYLADCLLAPVAFLAALAAHEDVLAFLPVLALSLLLGVIARDRSDHIEEKIVLTDALVAESTVARADALTGLANRRAWEEHLHALETARWLNPRPVSIEQPFTAGSTMTLYAPWIWVVIVGAPWETTVPTFDASSA